MVNAVQAQKQAMQDRWSLVRETAVKPVGKPDARCGHRSYVAFSH